MNSIPPPPGCLQHPPLFHMGGCCALPVNVPQNFLKPLREGALQLHKLPGGGVDKPQPPGVKALPRQAGDGLFAAVDCVPQQGVADGGQMDPDLMGAARLQAALHMGTGPGRTSG